MVNRTTFTGSSPPPLLGPTFFDEYAQRIDTLFDASALPLTAVGGTGDAVTATLDPPLAVANTFVDGMKFTITWGAANTGAVTLAINGGTALAVVDASGTGLIADSLSAGLRSLIEFIGGQFRVLGGMGGGAASQNSYFAITASGTWTKPAGLDDDRMVTIEAWGGGGGGGNNASAGAGGGGSYTMLRIRAGDLPSTVTVTIGAGGAMATAGGNTSFGAFLTAYGGGFSGSGAGNGGGGGGGELQAGANQPSPTGNAAGGLIGGGVGMAGSGGSGSDRGNARTLWGGGGGGSNSSGRSSGGLAIFGGGGGASGTGDGGFSLHGGSGGAGGVAGSAPGGGGGRQAAGGRGEVRVWI